MTRRQAKAERKFDLLMGRTLTTGGVGEYFVAHSFDCLHEKHIREDDRCRCQAPSMPYVLRMGAEA